MRFEDKVNEIHERLEQGGLSFGQGMDDAMTEAIFLVATVAGFDLYDLDEQDPRDYVLSGEVLSRIDEIAGIRIGERRPLPYILGECYFSGHRFYIDDRTIIPRSYLSEWIPDRFEPWIDSGRVRRILDLCTGSGCIAISTALAFPDAKVTATDLSKDALEVAKRNVERYQLQDRVELCQGDLFSPVSGTYDLILCNPPYVSGARMDALPAEFTQEPELAFRGGDDGLDVVRVLLSQAADYLATDGALIVESGSASPDLESEYPSVPFSWLSTEFDEMVVFMLHRKDLTSLGGGK